MAHQSLYRKYRPQTFDAVVGQQHIERTLRNAVADGTVAHAYLFTGPRGTGKTTTARILAKALDCEKGPTGEPDGTCGDCLEIAEGRHPDVREIDAASNTGVDNVREEIIGRVNFAPTRGRYKVYIIDEVHMLSTAAFNALLKTLEEPPTHVVFILATTHAHKVPETILSRCQRFDFHRIGIDDIVGRLRAICDGEGFEVPDAALALIARHASGGMRDAITTLEQLASFTGGKIGVADVEGLLGEVDSAALAEIAGLVARRDIAELFRWVSRFVEDGTDLAEFVRELTGHVRNLYLVAAVGDATGFVDVTAEEAGRLASQAAEFGGPERLERVLGLLGELSSELRWSSDQRLSLEVALTRMARPQGEMTLEALAERVESLERAALLGGGAVPATVAPAPAPQPKAAPVASSPAADKAASAPAAAPTPPAPEPAAPAYIGPLDRAAAKRAWPAVMAEIKKLKPSRASQYAEVEVDIDTDGATLVLEFPADGAFAMQMAEEPELRDMLRLALASVLGSPPPFRYQLGRGGVRSTPAKPVAPVAPPVQAADDDEPPAYYETGAPAASEEPASTVAPVVAEPAPASEPEPAPASASEPAAAPAPAPQDDDPEQPAPEPKSSLERLLMHDLGGEIIGEHAPQSDDDLLGDEADDDGSDHPGPGPDDPGLFDDEGDD
ncbi:MAG: DNA polymerase III subunit gamma/tau [Coriobacteriia bacterium]|nr:DNA polymerase III subunit gamma/tau [Coriobacteriia bacterium]